MEGQADSHFFGSLSSHEYSSLKKLEFVWLDQNPNIWNAPKLMKRTLAPVHQPTAQRTLGDIGNLIGRIDVGHVTFQVCSDDEVLEDSLSQKWDPWRPSYSSGFSSVKFVIGVQRQQRADSSSSLARFLRKPSVEGFDLELSFSIFCAANFVLPHMCPGAPVNMHESLLWLNIIGADPRDVLASITRLVLHKEVFELILWTFLFITFSAQAGVLWWSVPWSILNSWRCLQATSGKLMSIHGVNIWIVKHQEQGGNLNNNKLIHQFRFNVEHGLSPGTLDMRSPLSLLQLSVHSTLTRSKLCQGGVANKKPLRRQVRFWEEFLLRPLGDKLDVKKGGMLGYWAGYWAANGLCWELKTYKQRRIAQEGDRSTIIRTATAPPIVFSRKLRLLFISYLRFLTSSDLL